MEPIAAAVSSASEGAVTTGRRMAVALERAALDGGTRALTADTLISGG